MLNFSLATLFYFVIYCFLGWVIEGTFNLIINGTFIKDNFLFGPFKPMYGFASVLLVWAYTALSLPFFIAASLIIPTVVEYLTAKLMLKYFNRSYWDYSKEPFNYNGIICIRFSFAWGALAAALVLLVHPFITILYEKLYTFWILLAPICLLYFVLDFIISTRYKRYKEL